MSCYTATSAHTTQICTVNSQKIHLKRLIKIHCPCRWVAGKLVSCSGQLLFEIISLFVASMDINCFHVKS